MSREEVGIYTGEAHICAHNERMEMSHITLCPTCDTYVVTGNQVEAYRELINELVNVGTFDTANVVYLEQLERAETELRKFAL